MFLGKKIGLLIFIFKDGFYFDLVGGVMLGFFNFFLEIG